MSEQAEFQLKFEDGLSVVEDGSGGYRVECSEQSARWETDKEVAFLSYSGAGDGTLTVTKRKLAISIG